MVGCDYFGKFDRFVNDLARADYKAVENVVLRGIFGSLMLFLEVMTGDLRDKMLGDVWRTFQCLK